MSSKLASLHAGLIARKGEARPAMAHPAFSYVDAPRPAPQPLRQDGERRSFARVVAPPSSDVPEPPAPEPARAAPRRRSVDDDHARHFRLTFRMTPDQRRRLRIAAAKGEKSLQELLSEALDRHLDSLCACELRECTCLAREGSQGEAH